MTKIIKHESGVYFSLPDCDYFADPALGSTDLKRLLISPAEYWCESLYNPRRPPDGSRYKERGHALHAHVLFGETEFDRLFARELRREDHPTALATVEDLKKALAQIGMSTSGRKDDLMSRLRNSSTGVTIFDDLVDAQAKSGLTVLKAEDYDRVVVAGAMIKRNPALERCFENGVPEVSVFWEQDGVRLRARFDYLRLQSIVDLKSFTNSMDRPIEQAINSTFWNRRHDIQASHYLTGREAMRRHIREGRVFGDMDPDWLKSVADQDQYVFVFVYHTLSGAIVTRGKIVRRGAHVDGAAGVAIQKALDVWKTNYEIFKEDMWVDMSPITEITADDEPLWMRG